VLADRMVWAVMTIAHLHISVPQGEECTNGASVLQSHQDIKVFVTVVCATRNTSGSEVRIEDVEEVGYFGEEVNPIFSVTPASEELRSPDYRGEAAAQSGGCRQPLLHRAKPSFLWLCRVTCASLACGDIPRTSFN
jgi:hypothetical protein